MTYAFNELVGAIVGIAATLAIAYLAVFMGSEPAVGALILIAGKLGDYAFRGRVLTPGP